MKQLQKKTSNSLKIKVLNYKEHFKSCACETITMNYEQNTNGVTRDKISFHNKVNFGAIHLKIEE